jgi:hypothetical protein
MDALRLILWFTYRSGIRRGDQGLEGGEQLDPEQHAARVALLGDDDRLRVGACAALRLPGALAVSTALFARYHGPGGKRFLGLSAAGLLLALLRLRTGNLWLVAGFHLAWNLMQKSVFGPPDGAPSLRPLHLHGPATWVGRPGHPEPGWLQILWTLGLAAVVGAELWQSHQAALEGKHLADKA